MRTYPLSTSVADEELTDLGDPAALGGDVVSGTPRISARVDFQDGEVTLTDEDGRAHTYRPGDSYLIRQGQVVLWEVAGPRVRKSFFNIMRG